MIRELYNKIPRSLDDIAIDIALKNVIDFTFLDTSKGIENEFGAYQKVVDYLTKNKECDKRANIKYYQKIADRLLKIYSQLRENEGLTISQLLENPQLRTPEMKRCVKIYEALTIKSSIWAI